MLISGVLIKYNISSDSKEYFDSLSKQVDAEEVVLSAESEEVAATVAGYVAKNQQIYLQ